MESSDLKETTKLCDHEMLNSILCRYQRHCNDKHIIFHTDIRSGTVQHIYPRDLTSLFCNLLENAVESAENIPDSFIELTVQKKENSPFLIIILINSCQNTLYIIQRDFLYPINQTMADMDSESKALKSRKTVPWKFANVL